MPNYSSMLSRSWSITKRSPWLFVYGLILSAAGGGFSGQISRMISFTSDSPRDQSFSEGASSVLGVTTNSIESILQSIPSSSWIILGISLILFVAFSFSIWLVTIAWSKASLIQGVEDADQKKDVSLVSTAKPCIPFIKPLIVLQLLIWLITVVFFASLAGISVLVITQGRSESFIVYLPLVMIIIPLVILFLVGMNMVTKYAERFVVLHKISPWKAIIKGFRYTKLAFFPTLVLQIIHGFISGIIGVVTLLAIGISVGIPVVIFLTTLESSTTMLFPFVFLTIALLLLLISGTAVLRSGLQVFIYSNWNLLFKEYKK